MKPNIITAERIKGWRLIALDGKRKVASTSAAVTPSRAA